jgi:hypothetical protein
MAIKHSSAAAALMSFYSLSAPARPSATANEARVETGASGCVTYGTTR